MSAIAEFLGTDATTQGNWKGRYGTLGASVAEDTHNLPPFVTFTRTGNGNFTWDSNPSVAEAPNRIGSGRIAGGWFLNGTFTLNLSFTDGRPCEVSLYAFDWDSSTREHTYTVKDFASGNTLDTRASGTYANGLWHRWRVTGDVKIDVTRTAGSNAVVGVLALDRARPHFRNGVMLKR